MDSVNLYLMVEGEGLSLVAAGAPSTVVKAARATVAQLTSDETATKLFGLRGFTKSGNPSASVVERLLASGLRNGTGFATGTPTCMVAAASNGDMARDLIAESRSMLDMPMLVTA